MTKKSLRGAEEVFKAAQLRDETVKDIVEKERAELAAKSARLRALRLAKEAAEREAATASPMAPVSRRPSKKT
jgi:hypothetical protein